MLKKFWHVIRNVVFAILLLLVIVLAGFVVRGKLDGGVPAIANYRLYIVLSGSMHPAFDAGSLVVVKDVDPGSLTVGAVIAFKDPGPGSSGMIITHRIVAIKKEQGSISYVTKGDANNTDDPLPVPVSSVIGEADYQVPDAGYLFDFAKSRRGLICLIILPGLLLAGGEIRNLFRYAGEWEDGEQKSEPGEQITTKKKTVASLLVLGLLLALIAGGTFAAFTATASNDNNSFTTGTLMVDQPALNVSGGWTITNAFPGFSQSHAFTVRNGGTVPLNWTASIAGSGTLFGPVNDPDGADDNNPATVSLTPTSGELDPGTSTTVTGIFNMPVAAGNGYQDTAGAVTLTVNGTQANSSR
jgi:signal peptidase